jgi:hypothetical protein
VASVELRSWKAAYSTTLETLLVTILMSLVEVDLHGCDPFSRVDSSVPYYALLRSLTTAAKDVDAFDVTALSRLPR